MAKKTDRIEDVRTLGGRLRQAVGFAGLKQRDIADHFGISEQAISQWFRNETSPDSHRIFALERLLKTRAEWLLHGTGQRELELSPDWVTDCIPILTLGQIPQMDELLRDPQKHKLKYLFGEAGAGKSNVAFAISISDSSMTPEFNVGDVVILDPAVMPRPGDFIAVESRDMKDILFRKIRLTSRVKDHEKWDYQALNHDWDTVVGNPTDEFFGTMVEHRRYRPGRIPTSGEDLPWEKAIKGRPDPYLPLNKKDAQPAAPTAKRQKRTKA